MATVDLASWKIKGKLCEARMTCFCFIIVFYCHHLFVLLQLSEEEMLKLKIKLLRDECLSKQKLLLKGV